MPVDVSSRAATSGDAQATPTPVAKAPVNVGPQVLGATAATLLACRNQPAPACAPLPPADARSVIGLEAAVGELRQLRGILEGTPAQMISTHGGDHLEQTEWPFVNERTARTSGTR